jgi:hypothetical protein
MLPERFDRSEQQFAIRFPSHCAEALAPDIAIWNRAAVEFSEFGFVVKKLDMSWSAVLEKVNDAPGFRCEVRQFGQAFQASRSVFGSRIWRRHAIPP